MQATHWTQLWNHISASLRLLIISITGLAAFFLLPSDTSLTIRIAIAWVIAGSEYLIFTYMMMYSSNENNMLALAKKEDDGAAIILLITVLASVASLFTIVLILSAAKSLLISESLKHIGLVLATYAVSWLLFHTAFALHYAHSYYQEYEKTQLVPLIFANKFWLWDCYLIEQQNKPCRDRYSFQTNYSFSNLHFYHTELRLKPFDNN
jgi:uncharacterized membrane protein